MKKETLIGLVTFGAGVVLLYYIVKKSNAEKQHKTKTSQTHKSTTQPSKTTKKIYKLNIDCSNCSTLEAKSLKLTGSNCCNTKTQTQTYDLGAMYKINEIDYYVKGGPDKLTYVTLKVELSEDAKTWQTVDTITCYTDKINHKDVKLSSPIYAKYVRFRAIAYYGEYYVASSKATIYYS